MADAEATNVILAAKATGVTDKYKKRSLKVKKAILGLVIIGIVCILIGSLVLAYFARDWNTEKWRAIIGIVFLVIGFVCVIVLIVIIVTLVRIYEAMNSPGFKPLGPEQYKHLKYPRQDMEN